MISRHVWTCVVFVSLYKCLHTKKTLLKGAHLANWYPALRVTWPFPRLAEHTTHFSLHFTTKESVLFQFSNTSTEELGTNSTSLQNFTKNYAVNDGSSFPDSFHSIMKHQAEVYKSSKAVHYINTTNPNGYTWWDCSFAPSHFHALELMVWSSPVVLPALSETPQTFKPFTQIFNLQNVFHMAESCSLEPTQSIWEGRRPVSHVCLRQLFICLYGMRVV